MNILFSAAYHGDSEREICIEAAKQEVLERGYSRDTVAIRSQTDAENDKNGIIYIVRKN